MALENIVNVSGRGVPVMGDDIDTDRIIPARFMKCVTFDGLGEFAFYDAIKEFEEAGKTHPLKDSKFEGASVLISGANFGCGSSREHAPQSLARAGIKAIISESFAEIFFGNCTTLGVPCVTLPREKLNELADLITQEPDTMINIDLENKSVTAGDWSYSVNLPETAHQALTTGRWDPITELLESDVERVAGSLSYVDAK